MSTARLLLSAWLALQPITLAEPQPAELDQAIQAMLSARDSPQSLQEAITRARSLGATPQAALEARFLYHVDHRDDAALIAMLPELEAQAAAFHVADSAIFALEDDWLAALEYVRALAALDRDDGQAFRRHVTQAFWLSPGQGAILAPYIEDFRRQQALKSLRLPADRTLRSLADGTATLEALRGESRVLVLHFFSPWSPESAATLPALRQLATSLDQAGLPLVNVLVDADPESITETREQLGIPGKPPLDRAFSDPAKRSLAQLLRVKTTPTVAIVDADGKVTFIGHPADPDFASQLHASHQDLALPRWQESDR